MNDLLRHGLKALLRVALTIIFIPLVIVAFLLFTPAGLKIGLFAANQWLPGDLRYKNVEGVLAGHLKAAQISYRYQDKQIVIKGLNLQWHPSTLLAGKVSIEKLNIADVFFVFPETPAPPLKTEQKNWRQQLQEIRPHLTQFNLPFELDVQEARIQHAVWQEKPGPPALEAASIYFDGKIASDILQIHQKEQIIKPYAINTEWVIEGVPQNYRFQVNAFNPQNSWVISGQVTPEKIILDTKDALIFDGKLAVHLIWNWKDPISWQANIEGQNLNLSRIHPDLPQSFNIKLDTVGDLDEKNPHLFWNAALQTSQGKIVSYGKYEQQWDINWDIDVQQLAEWIPFSSGSVKSTGKLHGALNRPITKGHLETQRLRWHDYQLDAVTADWNLDISEKQSSRFQVSGQQIFTPWFYLKALALSAQGKWEKHNITAKIQGYNSDLQLLLQGGFGTRQWQGALKTLTFSTPYAGTWTLTQPTALFASPERVDITAFCVHTARKSEVCLRGLWQASNQAWQAALTSQFNLQEMSTMLPQEMTINLPVALHLSAEGVGSEIKKAELTGDATAGYVGYSDSERNIRLNIKNTKMRGKWDKSGGAFNFNLLFSDNNSISADLTMSRSPNMTSLFDPSQALTGKLSIDFKNLALLQTILPDTISPKGKFRADFNIGGTLGQPLVNGAAQLGQSEIKIPGLNIQLNDINVALNAKGSDLFYTASAVSAGQPLHLSGKTHFGKSDAPSEITLTGDTVLLINTPLYTVYVSPDIRISLKGRDINIGGTVNIPKATLHRLEFQGETTLPEGEVIYIGPHPIEKKTPWNTVLNVTINLGDQVTVDSPGLKGKLSGSLTILSQPGQVVLGVGRINIADGIYTVYGRDLNIVPGSGIVYHRNPLGNPGLDIQATTRVVVTDALSQQKLGVNEITVGMNIGGSSSSPQVTLFSSAGNLSQADILSYLLLGTSSAGVSPTNMNLLLQALNALPLTKKGGSTVEGVTNQIKQSLGFTEFGVESETTFGPAGEPIPSATPTSYFVVGKRLTDRIYFRYKYDPFNSVNLFQVNYYISKNWSLQLETDGATQSGADILYSIETGTSKSANRTPAGSSSK